MKRIYVQAIGVWVVFVLLAIVNGAARELWYGPIVGNELLAHQISTVTGISLFLAAITIPRSDVRVFQEDECSVYRKGSVTDRRYVVGVYRCLRVRLPALPAGGVMVDAASRLQHSCGEAVGSCGTNHFRGTFYYWEVSPQERAPIRCD
jgi:hypothetical protein